MFHFNKYLAENKLSSNYPKDITFDEFIKQRSSKRKSNTAQLKFLTDDDGSIIVDFIGRFENIENDFKYICDKLGIRASLEKLNMTERKEYDKYYSRETIEIVRTMSMAEIEAFNYTF